MKVTLLLLLLAAVVPATEAVTLKDEIKAELQGVFGDLQAALLNLFTSDKLTVTVTANAITCQVAPGHDLKVSQLYLVFMPDFARSVASINFFDDSENPLNFNVDSFTIDLTQKKVTLKTRKSTNIVFVNGFLDLDAVAVEFTVTYDKTKPLVNRFNLENFVVSGTWKVGATVIGLLAKKKGQTYEISGSPGDVNIGGFFQNLGEPLLPTGDGLEAQLKDAGLDDFVLKNTEAQAFYDTQKKDFALCFSGNPSISGWTGFRLSILFHRYGGGATKAVTIGIELKSIQISSVIKKISGIDVSGVPFLGSLTVPEVGLIVSTAEVNPNLIPACFGNLLKAAVPYPRGVSLNTHFKLLPAGDDLSFVVRINSKSVVVEKSPNELKTSFTLKNATVAFGIDANSLTFPPGVSNVLNLAVASATYDVTNRKLDITVTLGDTLDVIPGWVQIKKPALDVTVTTFPPKKIVVDTKGTWALGPSTFVVTIDPQEGGKKGYIFCGSGPLLPIGNMLSFVASSFFPPGISIDFLRSFEIVNPSVCIPLGEVANTRELFLSGEPRIAGFGGVTVNFVSKKIAGKAHSALGLDFANTKFADLLKKLTGISIGPISLLDRGLKLGIIISSADFPGIQFRGQTLKQMGDIKKGLTLSGVFTLPSCGSSDVICKFLEPIVGSSSLQLKSTIPNLDEITVSASLSGITLGSGVTLESAGLQLKAAKVGLPSFGITCTLRISNPTLLFKGAFYAQPTGELQAELEMIGIWYQAFGIRWLAFGNARLSVKFFPGASVTAFEIGAEVYVGNRNSALKAKAYLGIDSTNPINNYFYASINKLTIGSLMNAFGVNVNLIKPIADSGYPDGLMVSYAGMDKTVAGINIQRGFKLKGTINILGFRLKSDIHVAPPNMKIEIEMVALNLAGGAFRMYAHPSRKWKGPYLKAEISPRRVELIATGYVELFGFIKMGATLKITSKEYIMEIRAPFFGIFQAYLRIHASYGSLASTSFAVHGELSTQWLSDLAKKVRDLIKKGADEATRKIADAQRKVDNAERPVKTAQDKLRSAQNKVNSLCRTRSCSQNCVGCPGWNGCCWRVWGSCKGCPGWNSCCFRVPNPLCVAANVACKAVRGVAYVALWAAEKALNVARAPFVAARAFLEVVKQAVKLGAQAASWIISHALTGLISIKRIWFDVSVTAVKGGSFGGGIRVSFLKRSPIQFSFSLSFRNPFAMIKALAERVWRIFSGRRRRDLGLRADSPAFPDYSERLVHPYIPGSYERGKRRSVRQVEANQTEANQTDVSQTAELTIEPTMSTTSIPVSTNSSFYDDDDDGDDGDEEALKECEVLEEAAKNETEEVKSDGGDFDPMLIPKDSNTLDTDEGKCRRFKNFFGFVGLIVEGIDRIFKGLAESMKPYSLQTAHLAGCNKIISKFRQEADEFEREAGDMGEEVRKVEMEVERQGEVRKERNAGPPLPIGGIIRKKISKKNRVLHVAQKVCDSVEHFRTNSREVFIRHNANAIRSAFSELNRNTQKQFNKTIREFLSDGCDSLAEMYAEYKGEGEMADNARRVRTLVMTICSRLGYDGEEGVGDMTVFKSHSRIKELKRDLLELQRIPVFCHDF